MKRSAGILLHITSLPSPYGIGSLGKEAREFADSLKKAGMAYWQILPTGYTGYGNSPYQCYSVFAGNPLLIDLELLIEEGLLLRSEAAALDWGSDQERVDYEKVEAAKEQALRRAFARFPMEQAQAFAQENAWWLRDFSIYMAAKRAEGGRQWTEWQDERLKRRQLEEDALAALREEMDYQVFLQYVFYSQWFRLKEYVNSLGIQIIGDIPIYVAMDSCDTWANRELFWLDEDLAPQYVAGVPPDYFSATGQLWGNPIYRWDVLRERNYDWWMQRIDWARRSYDLVRLDHFRGFESFWMVPYGEETAVGGHWEKGPGMDLIGKIKEKYGESIIAEDLGLLTDEVRQLLWDSGFPGMKVLQFAFDSPDGDAQPHRVPSHCVMYSGTHDNDTLQGWLESAGAFCAAYAREYMGLSEEEGLVRGCLRSVMECPANLAVLQMQDVLGLGTQARMNLPGTVGDNWRWRMKPQAFTDQVAERLLRMAKMYSRA